MAGLLLSLLLVSSYDVKMPDPYLGYGFNLFQEKKDTLRFRRKFLVLGIPFKIYDPEITDRNNPTLVIIPEAGYNTDVTQFNFSMGYEGGIPLGYRARMSAFVWGAQAGIHYNLFTLEGDYTNENGRIMNSEDKTSMAALVNLYMGPRFDMGDHYALRFIVNPRIIIGRIAFHTYRSEKTKWLGFLLSLNLQFEWGRTVQ